ncbi:hypothetical protein [Pseudophaeobacter sp. 1A09344]|uniref:hypothetical protein n=1 Tax=Pseudophaeobacter sp. 1A09344 TaxID=3098144 RepID=UPI0034D44F93
MSFSEMAEKATQSLAGWFVVTFAGGGLWVVRRVFTNQKQIEMLQREIEMRDGRREEDRQMMLDIRSDVKELRRDISQKG